MSELTWNTFRDHLILEYEIVKYDGDLGVPNFFVQLKDATCRQKVRNLMECFGSQRSKRWFTEDTFLAMLRFAASNAMRRNVMPRRSIAARCATEPAQTSCALPRPS